MTLWPHMMWQVISAVLKQIRYSFLVDVRSATRSLEDIHVGLRFVDQIGDHAANRGFGFFAVTLGVRKRVLPGRSCDEKMPLSVLR